MSDTSSNNQKTLLKHKTEMILVDFAFFCAAGTGYGGGTGEVNNGAPFHKRAELRQL